MNLPSSTSFWSEPGVYRLSLLKWNPYQIVDVIIEKVEYGKTSQPNRMKGFGLRYSSSDLLVWLEDGTPIGDDTPVRITGWLGVSGSGERFINTVQKIEHAYS